MTSMLVCLFFCMTSCVSGQYHNPVFDFPAEMVPGSYYYDASYVRGDYQRADIPGFRMANWRGRNFRPSAAHANYPYGFDIVQVNSWEECAKRCYENFGCAAFNVEGGLKINNIQCVFNAAPCKSVTNPPRTDDPMCVVQISQHWFHFVRYDFDSTLTFDVPPAGQSKLDSLFTEHYMNGIHSSRIAVVENKKAKDHFNTLSIFVVKYELYV